MNPEIALRKRSSLKAKISFPDQLLEEWNKPKKINWDVTESEPRKQSDSKIRFKDADTHYTEIDPGDDLYLQQMQEINKIVPTKEIMEEIFDLVNEDHDKESSLKEDSHNSISNTSVNTNEDNSGKFIIRRRSSIKDEFNLVKELLKQKKNDDELEPEVIEETMKNTLYNKCLGQLEDDESFDDEKMDENF